MTEWHRVVFSDESRFCLSSDSRRVRVWRRRGERSNPAAILERPTVRQRGIMVWGAIAYDSRSPLLRIQGTMTAQRYVDDVLRPVTLPYLQGVPNALYQQDNARPYTARISQQALQDVQMLPWPPYSPDLSPIEHVWDIIGRRLHALPQPRSEDELWQMVEREWRAILQDAIRTLIDTLPRRVAACIAVRADLVKFNPLTRTIALTTEEESVDPDDQGLFDVMSLASSEEEKVIDMIDKVEVELFPPLSTETCREEDKEEVADSKKIDTLLEIDRFKKYLIICFDDEDQEDPAQSVRGSQSSGDDEEAGTKLTRMAVSTSDESQSSRLLGEEDGREYVTSSSAENFHIAGRSLDINEDERCYEVNDDSIYFWDYESSMLPFEPEKKITDDETCGDLAKRHKELFIKRDIPALWMPSVRREKSSRDGGVTKESYPEAFLEEVADVEDEHRIFTQMTMPEQNLSSEISGSGDAQEHIVHFSANTFAIAGRDLEINEEVKISEENYLDSFGDFQKALLPLEPETAELEEEDTFGCLSTRHIDFGFKREEPALWIPREGIEDANKAGEEIGENDSKAFSESECHQPLLPARRNRRVAGGGGYRRRSGSFDPEPYEDFQETSETYLEHANDLLGDGPTSVDPGQVWRSRPVRSPIWRQLNRLLDLWDQPSSILGLNHLVVPTSTLLKLRLVSACRFRFGLLQGLREMCTTIQLSLVYSSDGRLVAENSRSVHQERSLEESVVLRETAAPFLRISPRTVRRMLERPAWPSFPFHGISVNIASRLALYALPHPGYPALSQPICIACGYSHLSLAHLYWSCSTVPLSSERCSRSGGRQTCSPRSSRPSPSDYFLFGLLQKELKGKRFDSDEDVQKVVQDFFHTLPKSAYKEGIYKLPERLRRCIESQGDYFE
ncbi:hypothetical protein LAZ67_X003652 [Cordylochernes scorpioides]|uniref:Tc1-like transposase DDE domain-containing protein n=1 Tax=Cordylochernes scorpioides TaxID=51811 RepID=A0ABY6LVB7_9ARAC|nr:hypothetical protein LAZ67_X003652 [Cordylochernes scorpioides]